MFIGFLLAKNCGKLLFTKCIYNQVLMCFFVCVNSVKYAFFKTEGGVVNTDNIKLLKTCFTLIYSNLSSTSFMMFLYINGKCTFTIIYCVVGKNIVFFLKFIGENIVSWFSI